MVSFTRIAATATAALCALASVTDALDKNLYGVNYDLRRGPDWDPSKCKTESTIASELKTLSTITKRVRTYALADCNIAPVLENAKKNGMTVWLGVWVSAESSVFDAELGALKTLLDAGLIDSNVVGFNVGSEAVYRKDITAEEAIAYLEKFKEFMKENSLNVPVAITDIVDTMIAYPDIVAAGDVVTVNQFPFWEKLEADKAAAQFKTRIQPLLELAGGKDVYITETGWSSTGKNENSSDATPAEASRYLNDFYELANAEGWKYYYFQAFDSDYKKKVLEDEETVEASFGIFKETGEMKKEYADLKFGDLSTVSKDGYKETTAPSTSSSGSTASSTSSNSDEDGPGKVNGGSAADGSVGSVGKKNSTSPSSPNAAVSRSVAGAFTAAIVLVSAVLGSL